MTDHAQKCHHCDAPCPGMMFCQECEDGYVVRKALQEQAQLEADVRTVAGAIGVPMEVGPNGDYMTSEAIRTAAEAFMEQHGNEVREALRPRLKFCVRLSKGPRFWDHLVDALDEDEARRIAVAERQKTEGFGHLTVVFTTRWSA